jgi:hypothetical protein
MMSKMADYYPLITKAVARLDRDAPGESRRALYERAHAALLAQMRTTNPPFAEAEIMREQMALEEAVRRVEEEARQRARYARVPTSGDLVTDADDLGKVPSMIVTGGATGRLNGVWRCTMRFR